MAAAPVIRLRPVLDPTTLEALVEMLSRAFDQDAHINWIVRQDGHRPQALRQIFRLLLTDLLEPGGEVYATDDLKAAALVYPPGVKSLGLWTQARVGLRFAAITGWPSLPIKAYGLNHMEARHPKEPHRFLQTIGVDPAARGQGHGSAVLAALLASSDVEGVPTYLETSNEENLRFYERHGFRVTASASLPRGPRLWQLLRTPNQADQVVNPDQGSRLDTLARNIYIDRVLKK